MATMRKVIIKLVWAYVAVFLASACSETSEYLFGAKEPFVEISASSEGVTVFTPESQKGYGFIRSNARWKVESLSDWLSCTTTEGEFNDTVHFQMSANTGNLRTGKIVVYNTVGQQKHDTLVVSQQCDARFIPEGYSLKILLKTPNETVSDQGFAELTYQVKGHTEWRVFTKAADGWATVLTKKGTNDGEGVFVVSKNEGLEERAMFLYVQSIDYPSLKDSIQIKQAGRPVNLSIINPRNKKVMLDGNESSFAFTVKGDGKWKIEKSVDWLELTKLEYEEEAIVFVKISSTISERSTRLIVTSLSQSDKKDTLSIEQKNIPDGRLKDSLALVALYRATKGENWVYGWKFELPLSDRNWPGVFFDTVNGELRVVDLSLSQFNLEGNLPHEIGWLTELIKIKLQRNKLFGTLPASFNRLKNLTHLYLTSNRFSGAFPDIPALQKLTWVELDFNRFEGEFPPSFSLLPKLTTLKMKYNRFDPNTCVPTRFGGWKLIYINPQRAVDGEASTDYKLLDCPR